MTAKNTAIKRRPTGRSTLPQPGPEALDPAADDRASGAVDPGADVELDLVDEEDLRIEDILRDEGSANGRFEVFRKDSRGRWSYLTSVPVEDWGGETKQDLAREFGGGDYRCRLRRMTGAMKGTYGKGFEFSIDRAVVPTKTDPAPPPAPPAAAPGRNDDRFAELIAQMQREAAEARREMVQIMQANQATLVTVLTAALTQKPVPPSEKLIEIVAERALKPDNQLATLITALVQLKKVADTSMGPGSGGNQEGKPDILESLVNALPHVLEILNKITAPAGGPPPSAADLARPVAPAAPPRTAPAAARPVAPAEAPLVIVGAGEGPPAAVPMDPTLAAVKARFAQALPQLCLAADGNQNPVAVADQLAEDLEDPELLAVQAFLKRPDWLAIMIDAHEPVAIRSVWFTTLRNAILDIEITPAAAPAAASAPSPANPPAP